MKRQQPERALQKAVTDYLKLALPPEAFFSAIPGGDRQMTLTPGYVAGLPDVMIIYDGGPLFIELKAPKGRLSEAQEDVHAALRRAGSNVRVCRSVAEVEETLRYNCVPLRATTQPSKVAA